jgi:hypothetical protein
MLVFESLSAGTVAVLAVLVAILVLVSLYADLVWPLTRWDLVTGDPNGYCVWWQGGLWVIFTAGSVTGFWYFSGAAFRSKSNTRRAQVSHKPAQPSSLAPPKTASPPR